MKPTLSKEEQVALGFSHIQAAVTGGHDLRAAWQALADLLGDDGRHPAVATAAIGSLLYLTAAIEKAGYLPAIEITDLNTFLHSGNPARFEACKAALQERDKTHLYQLVHAMITCIAPHQNRITFAGNMPTVAPLM